MKMKLKILRVFENLETWKVKSRVRQFPVESYTTKDKAVPEIMERYTKG